jgi:hypothetical protein
MGVPTVVAAQVVIDVDVHAFVQERVEGQRRAEPIRRDAPGGFLFAAAKQGRVTIGGRDLSAEHARLSELYPHGSSASMLRWPGKW